MFKGCLILIEFGKLGKFASSVGISEKFNYHWSWPAVRENVTSSHLHMAINACDLSH